MRDALKEKVEKAKNLKIEPEKVQKIAEEIEIAMFGKYTISLALFSLFLTHSLEFNWCIRPRTSRISQRKYRKLMRR